MQELIEFGSTQVVPGKTHHHPPGIYNKLNPHQINSDKWLAHSAMFPSILNLLQPSFTRNLKELAKEIDSQLM